MHFISAHFLYVFVEVRDGSVEVLRGFELFGNIFPHRFVVMGIQYVAGKPPDIGKTRIEEEYMTFIVHGQNTVRGGFLLGFQKHGFHRERLLGPGTQQGRSDMCGELFQYLHDFKAEAVLCAGR